MTAIKELIESCQKRVRSHLKARGHWSRTAAITGIGKGIPTLERGVYQPSSPQIKERYELFGRWEWATHGHWLSIPDLEALWDEAISDKLLNQIAGTRRGLEEGWPNAAPALFQPKRLSLFAASDLNYESIYLLWLEFEDEPELWVYDSNGESRYKNLSQYLQAYLNDDISAAERRWKLSEAERLARSPK